MVIGMDGKIVIVKHSGLLREEGKKEGKAEGEEEEAKEDEREEEEEDDEVVRRRPVV